MEIRRGNVATKYSHLRVFFLKSHAFLVIYLLRKRTITISYLEIVPALLVRIVLPHFQLELCETKLHHFPWRSRQSPLAVEFRLVVAIAVEIKACDGTSALRQVYKSATSLIQFVSMNKIEYLINLNNLKPCSGP